VDAIPPIVAFNAVAEAGYPDVECPAIFVSGCNLRCPYCMNHKIVLNEPPAQHSVDDVVRMAKNLDASSILISGGEPCLTPGIERLVCRLRDGGLRVRLSTNGCFPGTLWRLLAGGGIEFVAMDLKCRLDDDRQIRLLSGWPSSNDELLESIRKSKDLIATWAKSHKGSFSCEFRTTLYPPLFQSDGDIRPIGSEIKGAKTWVLQQFRPVPGMMGGDAAAKAVPLSDDRLKNIVAIAKEYAKNVFVRYP